MLLLQSKKIQKSNSPLKKFDLPEPLAPTAHAKQQQLGQRVLLASSGAAPCSPQAGSLTHYVDLWTEGVCNELVLVAQETLDDDLQVIWKSLFRLSAKQPGWWKGPIPLSVLLLLRRLRCGRLLHLLDVHAAQGP